MTDREAVTYQVIDRVFHVQLHGPPANALALPLVDGLDRALDEFDGSPARVLVITSALDGFFAAGADIKLMGKLAEGGNTPDTGEFMNYGNRLRGALDRLAGADRPSVAAIEGLALGGGLELALACTLRVGSRSAQLGLPESKLGLIPGAGGTQRLPRVVGRGRALDIMLTARNVAAEEAYAMGLLDRLVDPGEAEKAAFELAGQLATRSPAALTQVMRCVDDAYDVPLEQGKQREAERVTELFAGAEAREGLTAFLEKRRPDYA